MDHPITISPLAGRVIVRWRGETIVDTSSAVELREASYPPVVYVPREDARHALFRAHAARDDLPVQGRRELFQLALGRGGRRQRGLDV